NSNTIWPSVPVGVTGNTGTISIPGIYNATLGVYFGLNGGSGITSLNLSMGVTGSSSSSASILSITNDKLIVFGADADINFGTSSMVELYANDIIYYRLQIIANKTIESPWTVQCYCGLQRIAN